MQIISAKKNILGTMSFVLKIGKMKKAEDFCTYPIQKGDKTDKVYLQSHHRWAELNTKTGEIEMSARREQYANKVWLSICKANGTSETDKAEPSQLNEMLDAIRGTASPKAGTSVIFCDNSKAALV